MVYNCHNCRYNKGEALASLVPDGTHDAAVLEAVETLRAFFAQRCVACRRCDHDDIRIERAPHNVQPDAAAATDAKGSEQCTLLPPDVEDGLRRLLATVVGLDPIDALLLLHVARGGTLADFGRELRRTCLVARSYGERLSRATALAKWKAVCRRFAPFAAMRSFGIRAAARTDATEGEAVGVVQGELGI